MKKYKVNINNFIDPISNKFVSLEITQYLNLIMKNNLLVKLCNQFDIYLVL